MPEDLPASLTQVAKAPASNVLRPRAASLPMGADHELSSKAEKLKFQKMGKISTKEVTSVDFDDLERKLMGL